MSKEFTPEAREALWRCYELILTYGRQHEPDGEGQKSEDAVRSANSPAPPDHTSTKEVEYDPILAPALPASIGEGA
jgi:hypothetical protein